MAFIIRPLCGLPVPAMVIVFLFLILDSNICVADETLDLIATILTERDSTEITSVEPIGDFNADGYGDLAIGVFQEPWNIHEAVYLYYGGPVFDENPDLIFMGDPQNETYCGEYLDLPTAFGWETVRLGDFNGDGFDDFAVSAAGLCSDYSIHNGRVYIYFGSANPDTTADIIIDGQRDYDGFGKTLCAGDFNGDGLGDIFTKTIDVWIGQKLYVFLGSDPPDNSYDWLLDYEYTGNEVATLYGGFDINGDGFDDFCWLQYGETVYGTLVMLGSNPLNQTPSDTIFEASTLFPGDISEDGIDDFMITYNNAWYLCLGGNPLDIEPDYFMFRYNYTSPFVYTLPDGETVLILDCRWNPHPHSLMMFNMGVPFDTIPYRIIDYEHAHSRGRLDIGDINYDGIEDIAMSFEDSTFRSYVNIYSLIRTDIIDDYMDISLPRAAKMLYCYPNPFNSKISIVYKGVIEAPGDLTIEIYNVVGERVRHLPVTDLKQDSFKGVWDATDYSGEKVSSGIYFVILRTADTQAASTIIFIK